jgi:hypothetical protein
MLPHAGPPEPPDIVILGHGREGRPAFWDVDELGKSIPCVKLTPLPFRDLALIIVKGFTKYETFMFFGGGGRKCG